MVALRRAVEVRCVEIGEVFFGGGAEEGPHGVDVGAVGVVEGGVPGRGDRVPLGDGVGGRAGRGGESERARRQRASRERWTVSGLWVLDTLKVRVMQR